MVATFGRGGLAVPPAVAAFAPVSGPLLGNQVPPQYGYSLDRNADFPGPHPPSQPMGGRVGVNDGQFGADPTRNPVQPFPRRVAHTVEGQTSDGAVGQGYGYAGGATWQDQFDQGNGQGGFGGRLGYNGDPLQHGRQSWWRGGIQGFNDKLTVKDRHAYWDTGYQRQGTDFTPASAPPNTYNNPIQEPPMAELRTVNRTVSYQKGTDTTAFQDDLSRPYTWLGEQGSGWAPIYGGVPGLVIPYGTRQGVPYPIQDPTDGQGGRQLVWSGPPHGLHSLTYPDMGDTLDRYLVNTQMRPVRIDRPSNSPIAGQSYSQTVQYQGTTQGAGQAGGGVGAAKGAPAWTRSGGRGWAGAQGRGMGQRRA